MSQMHTLIQYPLCPGSRAIRLLMGELGLEFNCDDENPWEWRQELLAINPSGELPVLRHAEGPVISGVYAISEFLDEDIRAQAGEKPPRTIFPGNRIDRAEIRRLVDWFLIKMSDEVTGPLLHEKIYSGYQSGENATPDANALRVARDNLLYHMSYISHLTATRSWLAGDEISFADLVAASQMSVADYLGEVPWEKFEDTKLWYARIKSRPTFRPLLADRIPGTEPPVQYANLDF